MLKYIKVFDKNAPMLVRIISAIKILSSSLGLSIIAGGTIFILILSIIMGGASSSGSGEAFNGEYSRDLPIYKEIEGMELIPDEVAQLAVGTAVKYQLLPSVVISQWAYESDWGSSGPAKNDNNFFGITWFPDSPFPKGSARGIGGSEGGYYMKFPDMQSSFSYYGFMVATQSNFNASVGNKSPGDVLLILGRGGYAASGITESSPYYVNCMSIITSNDLIKKYDDFAIKKWGDFEGSGGSAEGYIYPFPNQNISSPYGWRHFQGVSEFHRGIDFAEPAGTPIRAINDGIVVVAEYHYSWGNNIVIKHNDGLVSLYAHQTRFNTSVGQKVKAGQVIGYVGSTGNSTGPHLHLEMANSIDLSQSNLIDPATIIGKK